MSESRSGASITLPDLPGFFTEMDRTGTWTPSSSPTQSYTPTVTLTPTVTARLLNRGGTLMADLPAQPGAAGASEFELPLSAFAAGEYLIELNAKSPQGTAQDSRGGEYGT